MSSNGWIRVSERLPTWDDCQNNRVIVLFTNGVIDTWNPIMIAENIKMPDDFLKVTHWMPPPELPEVH